MELGRISLSPHPSLSKPLWLVLGLRTARLPAVLSLDGWSRRIRWNSLECSRMKGGFLKCRLTVSCMPFKPTDAIDVVRLTWRIASVKRTIDCALALLTRRRFSAFFCSHCQQNQNGRTLGPRTGAGHTRMSRLCLIHCFVSYDRVVMLVPCQGVFWQTNGIRTKIQ